MTPQIRLDGFANIIALHVLNRNDKDVVILRAEGTGGNYSEHAVSENDVYVEEVSPIVTYKYKAAFIGDGVVERKSDSRIRMRRLEDASPPVTAGSFSMQEAFIAPPVVAGSLLIEEI